VSIPWHQILWSATWGNNVAALEWVGAAGVASWLLRKPLGRLARRVRDRLHAPVHDRITAMEERLHAELTAHRQETARLLQGHRDAVDGLAQAVRLTASGETAERVTRPATPTSKRARP
jgi:hypothetical protein